MRNGLAKGLLGRRLASVISNIWHPAEGGKSLQLIVWNN
ncbi:hypothetical protein RFUL19S_05238 [Rhizobacter fulvus]